MTSFRLFLQGCALLFAMSLADAQSPVNYDETKVPTFELTNPLKTSDGKIVDSEKMWREVRRPELLKLFEKEMFGESQWWGKSKSSFNIVPRPITTDNPGNTSVYNGKGIRYQWHLWLIKDGEEWSENCPKIDVLIYIPAKVHGKVPAFLGLNFQGNHTVDDDPGIALGKVWKDKQLVPAAEEERGNQKSRWCIEKILDRGYAVITAYYQDIEPDFDGGSKYGLRQLFDEKGEPGDGNAIATWALGVHLMRVFVCAEFGETIDADKIIVHGHSRLGKTALWAGALDERFAMVISNNSGCGGAALSRREYGETVQRINTAFPHWFCGNFKKYNLDVNLLPFDQHELIALIAPRPVYIASAAEDQWADPKGEFLSGLHADPVYRLLGTDGIASVTEMPDIHQPVGGTIGYHIRSGKHDVTEYDWEQFLNFADKHFKK